MSRTLLKSIPGATPARVGSLAVFALAGLLLLIGNAWRIQTPRAPLFPLARQALEFHTEWRAGGRVFNRAAPPPGLPPFARWHPAVRDGNALQLPVPQPTIPLPWAGAAVVPVDDAAAVLGVYGTPADGALVVIVSAEHPALLGNVAARLENEWTRYDFDAGDRRLLVWRRGPCVFALVTGRPLEEAAAWVPGPTSRPDLPSPVGARPGSGDPSPTP